MIEIYIDNKLVDLDNTNISLQKEFENTTENIPTEVEYSYTISIPSTMNNKEIFEFIETFDVANKFKRVYNADLYVDEQLILSGKFKVTSIENGYYKGNLYNPKKKTISEILGDRKLTEIVPHLKPMNELGDFDKINNYVCGITTSSARQPKAEWENVEGVLDNHVVYPYILYGLPQNNAEKASQDMDIYTQDLEYGKHTLSEDSIYPSFNVISVLKDMFKSEGYNLTGNIIDGNMKDFFNQLYQTFQFSQSDYVDSKEAPYYCKMIGYYTNYYQDWVNPVNVSPTLETMTLWSTPSWRYEVGADIDHDGNFYYGVDNPWSCGGAEPGKYNSMITTEEDSKHMFVENEEDPNKGIIIIPRSGWYKIRLKGSMKYPYQGDRYVTNGYGVSVGGTSDMADCTDLSEQPFEIQLKKGTPKSNPMLYSINSYIPLNPNTQYSEDYSVAMDRGGDTYIRVQDNENQRRYPKNGKTAYVYDRSGDISTSDFICGARLGGAWFSSQWGPKAAGRARRPNRFMAMGEGLALPDVSKPVRIKHYEGEQLDKTYKRDQATFDGYYLQMANKDNNRNYEYAEDTAQCLVRKDNAYSNFEGYNTLVGSGGNYHWDTTSNYGAVSWEGADSSSAATGTFVGQNKKYEGRWDVNTCVWLEKGDTLYLEVLMPYHTASLDSVMGWINRHEWINITEVNYNFEIGFVNGKQDWKPRLGDGIKTFEYMQEEKFTNVNQFLPDIKCNDYLDKFLKTFNLQLTMVDKQTFSIDTIGSTNKNGNVIDIDKICDINDAEFKPLKADSTIEYKFKFDTSETGYAQGNQSPHRESHSDTKSDSGWYDSGYTGSETLTNEANTSGSIKKNESQWSYNWYKTIHFINGYTQQPYSPDYADVSVISDLDLWKDGMSFSFASDEAPQTSKTMRLFTLKKNKTMGNASYSYISFKYDERDVYNPVTGTHTFDDLCNLVLPSNYYETLDNENIPHRLHLDYKKMDNSFDGTAYNNGLTDIFFNTNVSGGYDIEVPIKLSNEQYAATKQGTLYKLNDGLYKVKSIEGHDVNKEDDATLTLTTLK